MIDVNAFYEPCPCAEIRNELARLKARIEQANKVCQNRENRRPLSLWDGKKRTEDIEIYCTRCQNTMRVLTDKGRELAALFKEQGIYP